MNNIIKISTVSALLTLSAQAQVIGNWDYAWDGNLDGNNNGGTWDTVEMSMTTTLTDTNTSTVGGTPVFSWVSNNSFDLKVKLTNGGTGIPQELFAVITNSAVAPTTANADWTALYFNNGGTVYAGTYSNNPYSDHTFTPFASASYTRTNTPAGDITFDLSLNQAQLATLNAGPAGAGAGWEGFGYPFDNDGETAGNAATPYRMGIWMRAFSKGAIEMTNDGANINWKVLDTSIISTFDDSTDYVGGPTIVPEPSSSLLSLIGFTGLLFRRKRS